jgi:PAS domain S-box-containing protein
LNEVQQLAVRLEGEHELQQTIMENTRAQLAYLDADFNFVRVNMAYAEASGHKKDELIGRNHFDLFPDPENEAVFERVRDTGQPVSFRAKPFIFPDRPELGITYWDWTLVPVNDRDGKVRGLVFSLMDVTQHERLTEQLAQERAKLQAIIENAPEGIVVADEEARITLTNPAAAQLYARSVPHDEGYESHAELCLCRPDGTAISPRDLPLTRAALDGETHRGEELAILWPSGERRDLLVDTAPIRGSKGNISGAIGLLRDITERKRIEEQVRQYAEHLRVLHEIDAEILAAGTAQEIANASLRGLRKLVRCSLSGVELFDLKRERALVLAWSAEEDRPPQEGQWNPLAWREPITELAAGRPFIVEDESTLPPTPLAEALREEGVRSIASIPLIVKGRLMGCLSLGRRETDGFTPKELGVVRDVADQMAIGIRQAELHGQVERHAEALEKLVAKRTAELQASEARFRAIFEQNALGIALLDKKGRVLASNPALQRMLGRSGGDLAGEIFARFAHPEEEIGADLRVYREMTGGERDYHRVEKRYIAADDETHWANLVLSLVRSPAEEPRFVIAIVEDVTERKQAQAALIQSEKLAMTGRLAASLAHEVNNPLQTVIGCLGLAEESLAEDDGDDLEQYITMAHEELRRAARIVSRLRDLSRPTNVDAGEPCNVNALLERVLKLSRKELESRYIEVVRHLTEPLPQPVLVPDRMQQVFLNLVLNAIDVMPNGGQLTVSTRYDEGPDEVVVTFTDDGPGIPAEMLPHLFDPFFSTKSDGLGLGLFVSQNIVQEHGGRIEVQSKAGDGAAFTVCLPV